MTRLARALLLIAALAAVCIWAVFTVGEPKVPAVTESFGVGGDNGKPSGPVTPQGWTLFYSPDNNKRYQIPAKERP